MDSMWEYNAPQYVDFTKRMDDDRADAYFGMFASMHRIGHIIQVTHRHSFAVKPCRLKFGIMDLPF